jgi:hypothetical protein
VIQREPGIVERPKRSEKRLQPSIAVAAFNVQNALEASSHDVPKLQNVSFRLFDQHRHIAFSRGQVAYQQRDWTRGRPQGVTK